ncbi:MAG: hypothetical protein H6562_10035 [Lewinellaceae bacterium]|nr:hypothetical protein [Lewinellaceae bacterium]
MKTENAFKNRLQRGLILAGFCLFFTAFASAQSLMDYHLRIKTADVYQAGCGNSIRLEIFGDNGSTGTFWVQGSTSRNGTDEFYVTKADVGKISRITVEVKKILADNWKCEFIHITKDSREYVKNGDGGYYEFNMDKWFGGEKLGGRMSDAVNLYPDHIRNPRIEVTPTGEIILNRVVYTRVNFANNTDPNTPQDVMRYKENWGFTESVSISKTDETTVGASLTIGYESPESIYGKFSAELQASWSQTISKTRAEAREVLQSYEYDWTYTAPPACSVFKKAKFETTFDAQVYQDGENSRVVRKQHSQIVPIGIDEILVIPYRVNGQVVPVMWSVLLRDWLNYTDPQVKADIIRNYKNDWIGKGWVTNDIREFAENDLIRQQQTSAIYILKNGKRRHIPDPTTFNVLGLAWGSVKEVSAAEMNSVAEGPVIPSRLDDNLYRAENTAAVFAIKNRQRRYIPDPPTLNNLGYTWGNIKNISAEDLNQIPQGTDFPSRRDGTLVRAVQTAPVYIIFNGVRRHVPDPTTFAAMGLSWANVRDIPAEDLEPIPLGAQIPSRVDGLFYKATGPEVYVMQGGMRRRTQFLNPFGILAYHIQQISDEDLREIPLGNPLVR